MSDDPPVRLERPARRREAEFLALERESRALHRPWVTAPATSEDYRAWLGRTRRRTARGYFVVSAATNELAGVINLSEIVRGNFLSVYLGYYAFAQLAGHGYLTAGLRLALDEAFGPLDLHRVEANIQPENTRSLALVKRLGFRLEGLSPRYLRIGGHWRDHERWALLADEWESLPR